MLRALPLTVALLLAAPALAQNLPSPPPGAQAMTATTKKARLILAKGGGVVLNAGTEVELLGVDPAAGTARVRFQNLEGSLPLAALGHDGPPPAGAMPAPQGAAPLPPGVRAAIPPGATVHELSAADLAKLPPEARRFIKQLEADAANAKPGEVPAPRTLKLESSTPWQQVAPGSPPPMPDGPAGATVTVEKSEGPVTRSESRSPTVRTERQFKTKAEAERYIAEQQARAEADAKAKAEALLKAEAAKHRPPDAK